MDAPLPARPRAQRDRPYIERPRNRQPTSSLRVSAANWLRELLGDPQAMVNALERVHELRDVPLDKKSLTHPTGHDRIRALRELAASRAVP